jgi:chromosome segregation ATPase
MAKLFFNVPFFLFVFVGAVNSQAKTGHEYFHDYEVSILLTKVESAMQHLALPVAQSLRLKDWNERRVQGDIKLDDIKSGTLERIKTLVESLIASKKELLHLQDTLDKQATLHAEKAQQLRDSLEKKRHELQQKQDEENEKVRAENAQAAHAHKEQREALERELQEAQSRYDTAVVALQGVTVTATEKSQLAARVGKRAEAYRAKIEERAQQHAEARAEEARRLAAAAAEEKKRQEAEALEQARLEAEALEQKRLEEAAAAKSRGFFGSMWALAKTATATVAGVVSSTVKTTVHAAASAGRAAISVGRGGGHEAASSPLQVEEEKPDDIVASYLQDHADEKRDLFLIENHFQDLKRQLDALSTEQDRLIKQVRDADHQVKAVLSRIKTISQSPAVQKALIDYTKLLEALDADLSSIHKEQTALAERLGKELTEARIKVEKLNREIGHALSDFHAEASGTGERLIKAHADLVGYLLKNACQEGDTTEACNQNIRDKVEKRIGKLTECDAMRTMKGWNFNAVIAKERSDCGNCKSKMR